MGDVLQVLLSTRRVAAHLAAPCHFNKTTFIRYLHTCLVPLRFLTSTKTSGARGLLQLDQAFVDPVVALRSVGQAPLIPLKRLVHFLAKLPNVSEGHPAVAGRVGERVHELGQRLFAVVDRVAQNVAQGGVDLVHGPRAVAVRVQNFNALLRIAVAGMALAGDAARFRQLHPEMASQILRHKLRAKYDMSSAWTFTYAPLAGRTWGWDW